MDFQDLILTAREAEEGDIVVSVDDPRQGSDSIVDALDAILEEVGYHLTEDADGNLVAEELGGDSWEAERDAERRQMGFCDF